MLSLLGIIFKLSFAFLSLQIQFHLSLAATQQRDQYFALQNQSSFGTGNYEQCTWMYIVWTHHRHKLTLVEDVFLSYTSCTQIVGCFSHKLSLNWSFHASCLIKWTAGRLFRQAGSIACVHTSCHECFKTSLTFDGINQIWNLIWRSIVSIYQMVQLIDVVPFSSYSVQWRQRVNEWLALSNLFTHTRHWHCG